MKINDIVFDREAKEYVKISNGIDGLVGGVAREFEPTEAIAIRYIGVNKKGMALFAYTYRKVNPAALSIYGDVEDYRKEFDAMLNGELTGRNILFIGRI